MWDYAFLKSYISPFLFLSFPSLEPNMLFESVCEVPTTIAALIQVLAIVLFLHRSIYVLWKVNYCSMWSEACHALSARATKLFLWGTIHCIFDGFHMQPALTWFGVKGFVVNCCFSALCFPVLCVLVKFLWTEALSWEYSAPPPLEK